jgi:superfamily II DNA or RNA helicase
MVIHLEVPWNPAVLEQRVGRVHRLGQNRTVHVYSLVTRGTIEERVLQIAQQKRELFTGLFASDSDEIDFAALGQPTMVDAVRDAIGDGLAVADSDPNAARIRLVTSSVQLLESLAEVLVAEKPTLPADVAARARSALQTMMDQLEPASDGEA